MNHRDILQKLNDAGHQAYIVGGAVRDKLLGLPVSDIDLATSATPEQVLNLFPGNKPLPSRANAPVVSVNGYEVASFRKEQGDRHNATFEPGTLEEDALRRDFPINALYEDIDGNILDPSNRGLARIKARVVSIMGDDKDIGNEFYNKLKRMTEDPTRVLRMYRLAAQLQFTIDDYSRQVVRNMVGLHLLKLDGEDPFATLADEQVGRELRKLLSVESGKSAALSIKMMWEDLVLDIILPKISSMDKVAQGGSHQEGNVLTHTLMAVERTENDPVLRMAALYHDVGKKATQAPNKNGEGFSFHGHERISADIVEKDMKRMKAFNNSEMESVKFLVLNHMRMHELSNMSRKKQAALLRHKDASRAINLMKADTLGRIPCANNKLQAVLKTIEDFYSVDKVLTDFDITGKLLVSLGEEPGPKLGAKLQKMENILTKNPEQTKEELLKAVGLSIE